MRRAQRRGKRPRRAQEQGELEVVGEHQGVRREDEADRGAEVDVDEGSKGLLLYGDEAGDGGMLRDPAEKKRERPREKKIRVVTLYPTGFTATRFYMHRHCTVWVSAIVGHARKEGFHSIFRMTEHGPTFQVRPSGCQ